MAPSLILWLMGLTVSGLPSAVLGVEASGAVSRWAKDLRGLEVASIVIDKAVVTIDLGDACVLRLQHPEEASCPGAIRMGDAVVCWQGESCPQPSRRAASLDAAGPIRLPWRQTEGDGMAEDGGGDAARRSLIEARRTAQERLDVRDRDGARAILEALTRRSDLRPDDLLSILPALGSLGAGARAWEVLQQDNWSSVEPSIFALARLSLLQGPALASLSATHLLTSDNACDATSIGSAFLMTRHLYEAGGLMRVVRRLDPLCWGAYGVEAEAWAGVRDAAALGQLLEAAKERFPDEPQLAVLEEMTWLARGEVGSVVERLEARISAGDRDPGLFKDLLALYVREELRGEKMRRWVTRAETHPDDVVASFFAGVLLHYEKKHRRSQELLEVAGRELDEEPRLHIYRAMNAFNLGDRAQAEREITRAAELEAQDPDVHYCQGEIFRDQDPKRALEALRTYWHQTALSSDPESGKQRRVKAMIRSLEKCIDEGSPGPCDGPWEHRFGAAAGGVDTP